MFSSTSNVATVAILVLGAAFSADAAAMMNPGPSNQSACSVTISERTVQSESKPRGPIKAILVAGAATGNTGGGAARAEPLCAYFYEPDVEAGSSTPLYKGRAWPYIKVGQGCTVKFDASVPATSKLRSKGFVTVCDKTRLLLLGGLPIYQYDGDDGPDVCYCNIPGEWSSVNSSGAGAAFTVTYPA